MSKKTSGKISIGIDTILKNGSISLFSDNIEIDHTLFPNRKFDSESVLVETARMIDRNGLNKKDIKSIYMSVGGASSTKSRICFSTVYGIQSALGVDLKFIEADSMFDEIVRQNRYVAVVFEISELKGRLLKRISNRYETSDFNFSDLNENFFEIYGVNVIYTTPEMSKIIGNASQENIEIKYLHSYFSYYTNPNASDNDTTDSS